MTRILCSLVASFCPEVCIGDLDTYRVTKTRALEWVPKWEADPLFISAIIVVSKNSPDKWRVCFDGSPIKEIESYTQPCHLDSCRDALKVIQKEDLLVKIDDKQSFHQLNLDEQSRRLAWREIACDHDNNHCFDHNPATSKEEQSKHPKRHFL